MTTFRMGSLDHVHVRVPDRDEAARWYREHLGFEPVEEFAVWATEVERGPLQISADGGRTGLALFEIAEGHPAQPQETGIAFSVDAETFAAFVRALPGDAFRTAAGEALEAAHLVDFDRCWAIDLVDPWGNRYELNCYDYDVVLRELVDADGITPTRYWEQDLRAT